MLFQMQIPEMFSYVGMKDTKYYVTCFLFLPKNTQLKRVKTEHNLATQAVYEHLYTYSFDSFPFDAFIFYNRYSCFYLLYLVSKGIFHLGVLISRTHTNVYMSSLLYCQFFHMYSTYIQRIEIALLSDPWCIQLTLNTDSRRSNTDKYSLTICTYKLYRYTNEDIVEK